MKPNEYYDDEGQLVIEWIGDNHRFGLYFGDKPCWTFVSKCETEEMDCGDMPEAIIKIVNIATLQAIREGKFK